MLNLETVLLQAPGAGSPVGSILLMVGMFVVMYFFLLRPQAKRQKEQKKFADSINSGDYIITSAGIHGTINRVNDDGTLQLEVYRGTFIKIERSAVSMEMTAAYRKKAEAGASTTVSTTK